MIEELTLRVAAIESGTVIDHVTKDMAIHILRFLQLGSEKGSIMVGINIPSTRMGVKDLIKIERIHLDERQKEVVALFSPNATINKIENSKVVLKSSLNPLNFIEGIINCKNTHCITNHEQLKGRFNISYRGIKLSIKCCYCERTLSYQDYLSTMY